MCFGEMNRGQFFLGGIIVSISFDKVSLFYVAADATIRVLTTVAANGQSCHIVGKPLIEIDGETIQLGCVRITAGALRAVAAILNSGKCGVIQEGDYTTADPNTRKGWGE